MTRTDKTTDHDLLALIEKRGYESLRAALRAVVRREDATARPIMDGRSFAQVDSYKDGYNQCLADIKADIEKELG